MLSSHNIYFVHRERQSTPDDPSSRVRKVRRGRRNDQTEGREAIRRSRIPRCCTVLSLRRVLRLSCAGRKSRPKQCAFPDPHPADGRSRLLSISRLVLPVAGGYTPEYRGVGRYDAWQRECAGDGCGLCAPRDSSWGGLHGGRRTDCATARDDGALQRQ